MQKPFLLSFFSEIYSGPGKGSQTRIWEYAKEQAIRLLESVTLACECVCVRARAGCSPRDCLLRIKTAWNPCRWLLDMKTEQLGTFQSFVSPPSNKYWWNGFVCCDSGHGSTMLSVNIRLVQRSHFLSGILSFNRFCFGDGKLPCFLVKWYLWGITHWCTHVAVTTHVEWKQQAVVRHIFSPQFCDFTFSSPFCFFF